MQRADADKRRRSAQEMDILHDGDGVHTGASEASVKKCDKRDCSQHGEEYAKTANGEPKDDAAQKDHNANFL